MLVQTIAGLSHPAQSAVWQLLSRIPDPEIPVVTIAELGMLREVRFEDQQWVVTFTPTYSGCPATDMLINDITECMNKAGYTPVKVEVCLDPAWTTDWLSEASRRKLADYGIAPPQGQACFSQPLPDEVICPHCQSKDTKLVSEFGSTACKAHFQCRQCYEPFDYFKCI